MSTTALMGDPSAFSTFNGKHWNVKGRKEEDEVNLGNFGFKCLQVFQTDFIPAPTTDYHCLSDELFQWELIQRPAIPQDMAGGIDMGARVR